MKRLFLFLAIAYSALAQMTLLGVGGSGSAGAPAFIVPDAFVDGNGTTTGTVVTTANLATATIGNGNTGGWSLSTSPLSAMTFAASRNALPISIVIDGVTYPISHSSQSFAFNHSFASETANLAIPYSTSSQAFLQMIWAGWITFGPSAGIGLYDYVSIQGKITGNPVTAQLNGNDSSCSGGTYCLNIETGQGANLSHSPGILITQGGTYYVTLLYDGFYGFPTLNIYDSPTHLLGTTQSGGYVTTSGTAVTWSSGSLFLPGTWSGSTSMKINGSVYTISSCASSTSCTLTTSAGTQSTPVPYSVGIVIGEPVGSILIGNNESGTSPGTTSYFEDMAISWHNPVFPMGPKTGYNLSTWWVQGNGAQSGFTSTPVTVALPYTTVAGDCLWTSVFWSPSSATASVSDNVNGSWTAVDSPATAANTLSNFRGQSFYKCGISAGSTTVSASTTASGGLAVSVMEVHGVTTLDQHPAAALGTAVTAVSNSATTTTANELLIPSCLLQQSYASSSPIPAPWTSGISAGYFGQQNSIGYQPVTSTGTYSGSFNQSSSGDYLCLLNTFK